MKFAQLLCLAALVAGAAAWRGSANEFNFFPSGAHSGCQNGNCAFPGAWHLRNQTAYKNLGNADANAVLKIAVSDYYPEGPTLYVVPGAWCDMNGAVADGTYNGLNPRTSRRKLAQSKSSMPSVSVNGGATCFLTGEDAVSFKVGSGAPQLAPRVNGGAYKIALPNDMPDGETCVEVMATYDTSKVATSPDYKQFYQPLEDVTVFSRKVCLYKLTKQADATLTFDMCTSNKFTLNITDISPLPVNISRFDEPLPENLFHPLIKMWGNKVSELDGTPSGSAYDEISARSEANYIAKYIPIPPSYAGEQLTFPLSDQLQEGYYEVSAVVSVITQYPFLTNLTGLNKITQDDASGTSASVTGLYEAASRLIHNNTRIGVQKNSTITTLSAISSSSHAQGRPVEAGDKIVLNWKFRGIGSATCTHDGLPVSNAPHGKCVTPLTITAKDFGERDTRHSVVVTFTDVCGRVRQADFEYTQQGVKTLTATETLAADGSIKIVGIRDGYGNAAAPARAGAAATVAAAAAGVALPLLLAL